jgi:hypothetical protein
VYTAQEVIKNRFWIVKNDHSKVGTLRSCESGFEFFDQRDKSTQVLDTIDDLFTVIDKEYGSSKVLPDHAVNGFSTGITKVYPKEYKHYPAYTKTETANTLYGAGYYIIEFKGTSWQWAFNPKISTLEKYPSKGPYLTEWEVNLELKKHRR